MMNARRNVETARSQLTMRRAELVGLHQRIERDLGRQNDPLVADFADQAVQRQNDEVLEGIGSTVEQEMKAIDTALERIAAGQYGSCERCGGDIERRRLKAVPYSVRCMRCAMG